MLSRAKKRTIIQNIQRCVSCNKGASRFYSTHIAITYTQWLLYSIQLIEPTEQITKLTNEVMTMSDLSF